MNTTALEVVNAQLAQGNRRFSPKEFDPIIGDKTGEQILQLMDGVLMERLYIFRELIGAPIMPSKVQEGHIRNSGTSMHNINHTGDGSTGLSRATDWFTPGSSVSAFHTACACGLWGGVGIYFDTKRSSIQPGPMLHVDIRPRGNNAPPVRWFRHTPPGEQQTYVTLPHPTDHSERARDVWRQFNLLCNRHDVS